MTWPFDFSWVTPDLAVGGCFPCDSITDLARDHAFTGIIDLREEACDDAATLARYGITFLHLPTVDHAPITPAMLDRGVAFVRGHRAPRRALLHCRCGIGRSALLALCVLVDRGMSPLAALELAKQRRGVVSPNPEQYEAWASWLRGLRAVRSVPWHVPTFAEFSAIAYRHLRSA